MNRGDRRERIFNDDTDRQLSLDTLGEIYAKTEWQVHLNPACVNLVSPGQALSEYPWSSWSEDPKRTGERWPEATG